MLTLGINAVFHDSSACLVRDGEILAAVEEERFTSIKHGKRPVPFSTYELPFHAIDYCLSVSGAHLGDVDRVAYSFDPSLLLPDADRAAAVLTLPLEPSAHPVPEKWRSPWDPLFLSSVVNAPRQLVGGWPHHLQSRLRGVERETLDFRYLEHHLTHAASAFHASPFPESAVMTIDGRGEVATTAYWHGEGRSLRKLGQVEMPHSLGLLYERLTEYLGFLHSSDEYKVMALASFGKPVYLADFRRVVQLESGGHYSVAPMDLEATFGPSRLRGAPLEQRHYDIAHSLQVVLEETVLELAHWLQRATGAVDLCLAGGVALNCVMNRRLERDGPFRRVWVQPAAGDAGTALGAALWEDARAGEGPRQPAPEHAYFGPEFSETEIEGFLGWSKVPFRRLTDVVGQTADLLAAGKVVGWFQGRMEFGPRALGARSILAAPMPAAMQARLNDIKDREDFRPVAPAVLEEEAPAWFAGAHRSPFMLFVYDVRPEKAHLIPAVRHVDGTARIQTVNRAQNPLYYDLIRAFAARTGVPVLINTSFNTRGEPIVCTPRQALESFWTSPLDALIIGPFLVEKQGGLS